MGNMSSAFIKKKEQLHLLTEHGKGATTTYDVEDPGLNETSACEDYSRFEE